MKKLELMLKPLALDNFRACALQLGISEFTVAEVQVSPALAVQQRRRLYRDEQYALDLLPRVKVEFVVADAAAQSVAHGLMATVAPEKLTVTTLDDIFAPASTNKPQELPRTDANSSESSRVLH